MTASDAQIKVAAHPTEPLEDYPVSDPYREWLAREGVEVIEDFAFEDLMTLRLSDWPRKGGAGVVINIPYSRVLNDAQVIEIAPGSASEPEHHLYEENVFVLSGHGATAIWPQNGERRTFEWGPSALFAIPLNASYQHFNASGSEPVRYLSVTNAPPMFRLLADEDAIFNCDRPFLGRFGGERDFFSGEGTLYTRRIWESNFIPNAADMPLWSWQERGGGGVNVMLEMAKGNLKSHISEFPVGTYKKGHRHGPGAHLVILSGQGFSLLWTKEDLSDLQRADWKTNGMVIVPSDGCYHQHFNTGSARARYLALRPGSLGAEVPSAGRSGADVSIKEGGWQVEYEDEHPRVHEMFEAELAKNGAPCLMKAFITNCTGEIGPTDERLT